MDGAFPNEPGRSFDSAGRGPRPGGGGRGFRGTAENAKTKLCTRWMSGDCRFGDRCNFAHGEHELRSLPPRGDDFGRGRGAYGGPPRGGYGGGGRGMGGFGGGRGRYDDYYGGGGYGQGGYGAPGYGAPQDPYAGGYGAPARGPGEDPYARQGHPVTGPNGWVAYRAPDTGETYYHNHNTGVTQWERPPEWLGPM